MTGAVMTTDAAAGADELDALLTKVGKGGFVLHAFRTDLHGPEIVAFVHDWGALADVVILFDADRACAHRTPTGPGIDLFAPRRVLWCYASSPVWTLRSLLTLDSPAEPNAPSTLIEVPPGYGLPAEGRLPVRIRFRGSR